jgi:acetolactate synthase regulatory subunit
MKPASIDRCCGFVTISINSGDLLAIVERIVGMLRHRRYSIAYMSVNFDANTETIVISGRTLHDDNQDAMIVRRLRRLPGVISVVLAGPESAPAPS